jgi:Tol biopolymer transport system component
MAVGWPTWSRDGRSIYFEDNATTGWYRLSLDDGKLHLLTPIKDLKFAESTLGWIGVTPDGSLLATRDAGSTQMYVLDWEGGL